MDRLLFPQEFLKALATSPLAAALHLPRMCQVSYAMDLAPLQDAYPFRIRYIGWSAARYLMDDKGEVNLDQAHALKDLLQETPFTTGPNMEQDADIYAHLLHCLNALIENKAILQWIKKCQTPLCHRHAVHVIQETLWPEEIGQVETAHVRRAVLTAWLAPLRQGTGSCFATAPAILIQKEQPERFFKDMHDLLSMGQLSRTFGGVRYTVPLSPSPGMGDLQKPLSGGSLLAAPGLRIAFEAVGVVPTFKEIPATVEALLRHEILAALQLSEGDLVEERQLAALQMTPLLAKQGAVHYQKPTERGVRMADFERRFSKARRVFRSITECALLRSWEYSLASLSDVKIDFARWNLYVSLGLHPQNEGGIGSAIYQFINHNLQACNRDIEQHHRAYELALSSVRSSEALLHRSGGADRHHLQVELAKAMREANVALELRDRAAVRAKALAESFPKIIEQYDKALQEQFQEIFDPSIRDPQIDPMTLYNDSPAGFRLMYKHGRSDASLWTLIQSEDDYLQALRTFFGAMERDLGFSAPLDTVFASDLTTKIVQHLATPEFLASAIGRARKEGRASPWHYLSGGTMPKLVQNYYALAKEPTEIACIPHSAEELMHFIHRASVGKRGPLLIHSPTHAFLVRPDWFAEIEMRHNTPAWRLTEPAQEFLAHKLADRLPDGEKPLFLHLFRKQPLATTSRQFRLQLIDTLKTLPTPRNGEGIVDSLLYEHCPLMSGEEAGEAVVRLLSPLIGPQRIDISADFVGSRELLEIAKGAVFRHTKAPFSHTDWDMVLAREARKLQIAYPAPGLFADTNWAGWAFGWLRNPVTEELELWRFNRPATQGFPMHEWKPYFSTQNTLPWIVLSKPEEYT